MKVLILTDWFLPSIGGVQQHTYILARYLSRESFKIHVVTSPSNNPTLDSKLDQNLKNTINIEVFRSLPNPVWNVPGARAITDCYHVAKFLKEYADNYDVVHYHGARQLFFEFVKSKIPIVTSVHGTFPVCIMESLKQCSRRSGASCAICNIREKRRNIALLPIIVPYYTSYYRLMRKSLGSVSKVICVSAYIRNYIERFYSLRNLTFIPNFIDCEGEIMPSLSNLRDFDVRVRLNLPSDAKIITYFGRLSFEKGVDLLVEAFKKIPKRVQQKMYLLIGGDGPEREQLEKLSKGVAHVAFTGFVERDVQLAMMAQSDLFVHPARYPEAFGITILEAMSLGLPVVATKVGGIPEFVIHGKGGYLVAPNSSVDLARRISNVLGDESFRSRAGAFNIKWSRRFDIKYLGPKIVKLYKEALE